MKACPARYFGRALLILALSAAAEAAAPQTEDSLTVKARALITALERSDYQASVRDFDATMLKVMGAEKMEQMWKTQLPVRVGAFKKQGPARREQLQGYEIVFITCEFAKASLDARVVFDKAGKVAGLGFVPTAPPVKYEPPAYADPSKFEETEVTIGSGDMGRAGNPDHTQGRRPLPRPRPGAWLGPQQPRRGARPQ